MESPRTFSWPEGIKLSDDVLTEVPRMSINGALMEMFPPLSGEATALGTSWVCANIESPVLNSTFPADPILIRPAEEIASDVELIVFCPWLNTPLAPYRNIPWP